jgi:hypothetical protein
VAGHLLTGDQLAREVSHLDQPHWAVAAASTVSQIVLPLMWAGVAIVGWRQWRLWRERRRNGRSPVQWLLGQAGIGGSAESVRDAVFGIALAALGMYVLLYAALGVPSWLGYTFAPFVLTVLFAWVAVEALARVRLRAVVIAAYGASVSFITLGSLWRVHQRGWDRGVMSPTLANQVEVARALNRYADATALTDVPLYKDFPHALRCLRLLLPPDSSHPRRAAAAGRLLIRYRQTGDAADVNRIELVELPAGVAPPDCAKPLDVTPLP